MPKLVILHLVIYGMQHLISNYQPLNQQPESPNLTWEKSSQTDIGLDFGVFNNRVSGEIDFYNKNKQDCYSIKTYHILQDILIYIEILVI